MAPEVGPGSVIATRYELVRLLGAGGMGLVFLARDRMLDELVALKLLRSLEPERVARLRREVKLAWRIRHRNVCSLHDYGEDGPIAFLTMEHVEGVDLKERLRSGPLAWEDAYEIALQIGEGLAAIHEAGVVHRDLKPQNVMIDRGGVVRLLDFGIAHVGESGEGGEVLGSPEYMSPEQIRGEVGFRTDVYAFGVVVFELFVGRPPFQAGSARAVLALHLQQAPPLEGPARVSLPDALVPVLRTALAKAKADRYPGVREMLSALTAARDALAEQQTGELASEVRGPEQTFRPPPEARLLAPGLRRALQHVDPEVRAAAAAALDELDVE